MKKVSFPLVLLLLTCLCSTAFAGGLSGLLNQNTAASTNSALPDPADALTSAYGTQTEKNYDYGDGYYCNVYTYEKPVSVNKFLNEYLSLAEAAGYPATETVLEGLTAYAFQSTDGKTAYLLPETGGDMLLLVETGMNFSLTPRRNFLTVEWNGKVCEYEMWHAETPRYYNQGYYGMSFVIGTDYHNNSLTIELPQTFYEGDTLYASKTDGRVNRLQFAENCNDHYFLSDSSFGRDDLSGSGDYFMITITQKEKTSFGERISGTFEGSFNYGETVFTNGVFSADCYD